MLHLESFNESCNIIDQYISEASKIDANEYDDDIMKCEDLKAKISKIVLTITTIVVIISSIDAYKKKKRENEEKASMRGDVGVMLSNLKSTKDELNKAKAELSSREKELKESREKRYKMIQSNTKLTDEEIDAALLKKDLKTKSILAELYKNVEKLTKQYTKLRDSAKTYIVFNGNERELDKFKSIVDSDV